MKTWPVDHQEAMGDEWSTEETLEYLRAEIRELHGVIDRQRREIAAMKHDKGQMYIVANRLALELQGLATHIRGSVGIPDSELCTHKGIGLPGCPTCDPRTVSEGGPRPDVGAR